MIHLYRAVQTMYFQQFSAILGLVFYRFILDNELRNVILPNISLFLKLYLAPIQDDIEGQKYKFTEKIQTLNKYIRRHSYHNILHIKQIKDDGELLSLQLRYLNEAPRSEMLRHYTILYPHIFIALK